MYCGRGQRGGFGGWRAGTGHGAASWMGPMIRRQKGDVKEKTGCSVTGVRLSDTRESSAAPKASPARRLLTSCSPGHRAPRRRAEGLALREQVAHVPPAQRDASAAWETAQRSGPVFHVGCTQLLAASVRL